jgi:hypothetical protein
MSNDVMKGDGFEVRLRGRSGLQYIAAGRTLEIDAEMLTGPLDLVIHRSSVGRWSDGEIVGDDEREEILSNVASVLASAGLKADFE